MNLKSFSWLVLMGLLLSAGAAAGRAQTVYSYLDDNGVRNFTNIPPTNYGRGVSVSGDVPSSNGAVATLPAKARSAAFDPIIARYAEEYRVDPDLVRSIIATESAFNPKAVSHKGAMGLMQLMPATASRLGVQNPFDPEQNIKGGTKHLRVLLDTFKDDLVLSLAAYNAGENLVQRIGRVPNIKETHDYVRTVTQRYGSRQLAAQAHPAPSTPTTYRYFDQNGVLHISNIPPVVRSGSSQDLGNDAPSLPR